MQSDLTVVIPVYNEGTSIRRTLIELRGAVGPEPEVLIVYDEPNDSTVEPTVHHISETDDRNTQPIRNTIGPGVVNAIRFGLRKARAPFVVVTMADLSDDLKRIPEMLALGRQGYSVVCGSRYCRGGRHVGGPVFKRALSRLAGLSLHLLTGIPTRDVSNSYKLYAKSFLDRVRIESEGGFEIGMELLVKAWVCGFRISEVPTWWKDRSEGESRFQLAKWLPRYLHWYRFGLRRNWLNINATAMNAICGRR